MDGADLFASGAGLWRAVGGFDVSDETRAGPGDPAGRDPVARDPVARDPVARVARDAEILEAVRRGDAPATARLWDNGRCLVATRSDTRLPRFAKAAGALAEEGWPVAVRESGGSAVPHDAGILHLSLFFRPPADVACTLESVYGLVALPLRGALAKLGLDATLGAAPGSFCDGRFNVLARGHKVAGTAQRWRGRPGATRGGRGAVLAHALLLVDCDLALATERVNRFYALAGSERRARPDAASNVTALTGASPGAVADALRASLTRS